MTRSCTQEYRQTLRTPADNWAQLHSSYVTHEHDAPSQPRLTLKRLQEDEETNATSEPWVNLADLAFSGFRVPGSRGLGVCEALDF